jgi:hypothetical protein
MRKQLMTIAAGLALGAASLATPALAAHSGHGGGGGMGHAMGGGGGMGGGHGFGGGMGGHGFSGRVASPQISGARGNLAMAPNASAQFRGHVAGNNYGRSGNWNHGHGGYGGGGVFAFGLGPFGYGPDYYDYSGGYADGCYQQEYVQTVYGPQLQWVDVCE